MIWFLTILFLRKIILLQFPKLDEYEINLLAICFAVYPLHVSSIAWGMSQKHLLSFLFITLSTYLWIKPSETVTKKSSTIIVFFYILSILSQPITILWPIWTLHYNRYIKKRVGAYGAIIASLIAMVLVGYANYAYYAHSKLFTFHFDTKTNEIFDIPDKILAFGYYIHEIILPYSYSFQSTLGDPSTLYGLFLFMLLFILVRVLKIETKTLISWSLYFILPLIVVLAKAGVVYNTYLLTPSLAFFMIAIKVRQHFSNLSPRIIKSFYYGLVLFSIGYTNFEARAWLVDTDILRRSFERSPSCWTAANFLRVSYQRQELSKLESAKQLVMTSDCGKYEYNGRVLGLLKIYMLLYENDLPLNDRLAILSEASKTNSFARGALIGLLIRENLKEQADNELDIFLKDGWIYNAELKPLLLNIIKPYCISSLNADCIKMIDHVLPDNK